MSNGEEKKGEYWFFLSYARRDARAGDGPESPWFKRFYNDLAQEVAAAAGIASTIPNSDIEFYDRKAISAGSEWEGSLAEALQSSKVFICLYSPSYFNSEYCGKEFKVFSDRIEKYKAGLPGDAAPPRLIIPVLWESLNRLPEPLPAAVSGLQYADMSMGLEYAEKGLIHVIRSGQDEKYWEVVKNLADKIVLEAKRHKLPRLDGLTSIKQAESAFHASAFKRLDEQAPVPQGPNVAWFVYAAGRKADYAPIRRLRTCYGDASYEWKPYLPDEAGIIGYIASTVAISKGLMPQPVAITDKFVGLLQEAEKKNTMVVIIVDPWSVRLPVLEAQLRAYDETRLTNCGVVIIWNTNDEETLQERENLLPLLGRTFLRNFISKDVTFQPSVTSVTEFKDKLGAAIEAVKGKIYQRGELLRGNVAQAADTFPKLPTANTPPQAATPDKGASTENTQ